MGKVPAFLFKKVLLNSRNSLGRLSLKPLSGVSPRATAAYTIANILASPSIFYTNLEALLIYKLVVLTLNRYCSAAGLKRIYNYRNSGILRITSGPL